MPSLGTNFCSYLLKALAVVAGIVAMIFTVEAGKGCDFVNVEDTDGDMLDMIRDGERPAFVFGTATKMRVGIHQYEILEGSNVQGCVDYPEKFFSIDGYPSLSTAQLCSILSPIVCAMAIICTLIDFCVVSFRGSRFCGGLFYMLAMGIQCGVFAVIADPVFCFEDTELKCTIGSEMYLAIAAVVFYFLASCFACCAPHSDPWYKNLTRKKDQTGGDEKKNNEIGYGDATTTTTTTTKRATVVLESNNPPVAPGGRRKSRPSGQTNTQADVKAKYDKDGNRIFN